MRFRSPRVERIAPRGQLASRLWRPHALAVRILALETSTRQGSVALLQDGQRFETQDALTPSTNVRTLHGGVDARHGDSLLPMVETILQEANLTLEDLALIAVGVGPGSFTGTRIGLAVAKGLVLGTGLPLVGISSFAALAAQVLTEDAALQDVGVVADAGRGQVFASIYQRASKEAAPEAGGLRCVAGPFEAPPAEAAKRLAACGAWVGSGTGLLVDAVRRDAVSSSAASESATDEGSLPQLFSYETPSAEELARIAAARFPLQGASDEAALQPLYVRASDAKLPAKKLRTTAP